MQAQCKPDSSQCKLNAIQRNRDAKPWLGTQISDFLKTPIRHAGAPSAGLYPGV
jgi:hypothetical protein